MEILRNILAVLTASTLSVSCFLSYGQTNSSALRLSTVVIDPGHGGKDAGCISKSGDTKEKTVVLDIASRLAGKIKAGCPDVNVIMTRDDDYFVTLQGRADIANRNNANLFISIHVNSVEGKLNAPNGYSVHILGQYTSKKKDLYAGNMDVVRRENSVILLEDNYTARYEGFDPNDPESYIFMNLMQNAFLEQSLKFAQYVDVDMKGGAIRESRGIYQDPFYVLWRTAMPAVLIECGFMSNSQDRGALITEEGRSQIASDIYKAFRKFKNDYEAKGSSKPDNYEGADKPVKHDVTRTDTSVKKEIKDTAVLYGCQILASAKLMKANDPFFKGHEFRKYKVGKYYKYIIGISPEIEVAKNNRRNLKKDFPDAFFVKIEKGEISRCE